MNRTEAAEILAYKTREKAREWEMPLGKDLVEAVLSEAKHWPGLAAIAAAARPSWRTILRIARADAIAQGEA